MRIKELTEQNMRLKDKVVEARENSKRYQEELLRSQERCSEIEGWNNGNQEMKNSVIKKLQEEKEELDKELQNLKRDLVSLNLSNGNCDADIAELSTELSQTKQDLQDCLERFKMLQEENQALKHDLLVASKKIATMQAEGGFEERKQSEVENCSVLHKLDSIRDQLHMYRENCSGLENEVKIYKEKFDACNRELEATKSQFAELKESSDAAHKEKVRLEQLLSETQMRLTSSEEDSNGLKVESFYFKERIQELEMTVRDLKKKESNKPDDFTKTDSVQMELESPLDVTYLRQQNQELEAGISLMSRKLSETETERCRSQSQVDELNLQLKESLDKIAELESHPEDDQEHKEEKVDANSLLQQAKRQSTEIRFTLQRKEKENKDLEMKLKETREEMHKMEIQTNLYETQRSQLREELEKEREKCSSLEEEYATVQQNISEDKASLDFHKRELDSKDAIIADLKVLAANMELKYHELSEKHTAVQELHEQYKKESQEIEDDLLQTQKDMADMQVDFMMAENEKKDLLQQLQAANNTIADLQSKLEKAEQDIKEKEHEMSLTTQRLTRMEEDLDEASKTKSDLELQLYESNTSARRKGEEDNTMQTQLEELQRECEGLREQVAEKELVTERLKDEISSLETDLGTLRTELSYKDSLNETSAEELKRLALKLKSSEEEISRLTDLCENTMQEKGSLEIDLSVAKKKIETMESNLKENGEKENNLVKTLQEERNKFVYKETDIATYRSKIAALELQSENHVKEKEELRSKVDDLDKKATAMKQQMDEILTSRDQAIRRRMELEEKMIEIQQDLDDSGKTKTQHEEEVQDLASKIAKYEVQIESLKRQNEELKEKSVEANIEVVNQREELMKLEITATEHQKMLESAQSNLEQKTKDYVDVQGVIKGLQAELNKVKNDLITSKISHEFALDENSRLTRKIQEQETRLGLFEKEVSDANEENRRVTVDLGGQTAKVNSLHVQLGSATREKERFKEDLQAAERKIQKLQEDLMLAHNQMREKERIVESYRVEMSEKDSQVEQLKISKESMEEKILVLKKELQTTAFYHESSQSKLKGAQDELTSLKRKLSQYETTVDTLVKERDDKDKEQEKSVHQQHFDMLLQQSKERQAILEKEIDSNKAKISRLEHDLKMSRQDCLDSQFENSKSQRLLEDLKVTHELCDKERRALREEVLEVNRKISDLELKYENEQRDNLALQSQLQDATNRGDTNRNEILKLSKQCVEQKILLDAAKKENEQTNSQVEELKSAKAHLEEKSTELRKNLTSAIGESEKLRGGHQQLQDEIIAQQKSLSNLKDRLQKALKAEQMAQEELKLKMSEIESMNQELVELSNEREELKNNEKSLENTLLKQREDLSIAENQIADLKGEVLQNKKDLGSKQSELASLKTDNCTLKEELNQTKDTLKKLKIEFESIQENKVIVQSATLQKSSYDEDELQDEDSELTRLKESLKETEENLQMSIESEHSLQDQLVNLQLTNTQLENKVLALKESEEVLKAQNLESQNELDEAKADLVKSQEEVNIARDQLEMIQQRVTQLETQNDRLEAAKGLVEEKMKEEREKVKNAEDELLEVQCKLQELQTKWDHNARAAEGNETVLDTVKTEKKYLEKDLQTLRDELSSAHALMNTTLRKNRELDQENFQLKKTVAEYETREEGFIQENDELSKRVAQHQKVIKELRTQLQQKQKEIAGLREGLENERQKVKEARDDYDNLMKDLSQFKGGVKDYKKTMSEKDAQILLLENKRTNLEDELKSARLKSKEAQEVFEQEAQKLNGIIQEKDNRISELDFSITKLKERNKKLQTDLTELKAGANEQKTQLQNAQKEIKKLNSELLSQGPVIAALQAKNVASDEGKKSLKDELNKMKRQCSEQKIQLEALKHENERLQRKLNEVQTPKSSPVKKPQTPKNKTEPDHVSYKKLVELENAYQNVILEKEHAESKNTSLEEKILEMEKETNAYLTAKDSLEKEIAWKDRRITELEGSLHKIEYSAQLDRNELQTVSKAMNEMESELNSTHDTVCGLEECNATYEEMIKHLEGQLAEIQEKNSHLENSLENSQSKLDSQRKELLEALNRVSDLENMRESSANSNEELLRDLQSSRNKISSLEEELCASAREQAKASLAVKETREQNGKLRKDLQQLQSRLREEKHDREIDGKELREKTEAIKKLQRENKELEDEISEATKEMNAKAAAFLTLVNKQEETQEELEALKKQIPELESSLMNEKGENEKLRLETSATRQLHNDLKIAYDNLLDEINNSEDQLQDKEFAKSAELQKSILEKDQLNKEVQLSNKRLAMLKENYEKVQREKRELEQKLKMMQQRLLVLQADEKTVDTIKNLQRELEEGKQKINDLNAMYEAVRIERDNLRGENSKPTSPRTFVKYEAKPRGPSVYLDTLTQKSKLQEQAAAKKEMLEAQARAMLLEEKLKMARERLEGLKNVPPGSDDSRSESTEGMPEELANEEENQEP
ncbi:uncharacterized protein LOC144663360 [Oculina patagonica]